MVESAEGQQLPLDQQILEEAGKEVMEYLRDHPGVDEFDPELQGLAGRWDFLRIQKALSDDNPALAEHIRKFPFISY